MTTVRAVYDDVKNVVDYLQEAELALFVNEVSLGKGRVSWHPPIQAGPPFVPGARSDISQFLDWVRAGQYSCVLIDGSLMQITYDVLGGEVVMHRLAYVPCPVDLDQEMLLLEPLADIVELCADAEPQGVLLKSPVRFDFDRRAASEEHPAAHLTLNDSHCRIACVAPMHIGRFADFVFRNFYPHLRAAHARFFDSSVTRHLGKSTLASAQRTHIHLAWALDSLEIV